LLELIFFQQGNILSSAELFKKEEMNFKVTDAIDVLLKKVIFYGKPIKK
jgi:hypothetical protein